MVPQMRRQIVLRSHAPIPKNRVLGHDAEDVLRGQDADPDKSFEILAGISSLESLTFWETGAITSDGIRLLQRLPRLSELTLEGLHSCNGGRRGGVPRACSRQARTVSLPFPEDGKGKRGVAWLPCLYGELAHYDRVPGCDRGRIGFHLRA